MKHKPGRQRLRIIGGRWRSRIVNFANNEAIRPTPDRVRETLFNWLGFAVPGAHCLELYAGSGILSIEALSRGAAAVTLLDHDYATTREITANLLKLTSKNKGFSVIHAEAISWLAHIPHQSWDLIFLDPPFAANNFERLLRLINHRKLLNPDGFVYIESVGEINLCDLPAGWHIHKQKCAAGVHYCLCQPIIAQLSPPCVFSGLYPAKVVMYDGRLDES